MNQTSMLTWAPVASRFQALLRDLRQGRAWVLVTVAQGKGSTPRDAGARMWVTPAGPLDTIGGGHLELKAIAAARDMLSQAVAQRKIERYSLGPSLGQCCGGVVWLAFEYIDASDLPWCEQTLLALQSGAWARRTVNLRDPAQAVRVQSIAPHVGCSSDVGTDYAYAADMGTGSDSTDITDTVATATAADTALTVWDEDGGLLDDTIVGATLDVVVCGAGHVGHAIVRLLGDLPVRVHWLDPRPEYLPTQVPANVMCIQGDESDVIDLPENAYWLVLTHSHALDLEIVQAVLQDKTFCFLGLIGSKTKKARFVSRLKHKFSDEQLRQMQCPIGLVATSSKLPSVIAVSVVAQLLARVTV